MNTEEGNREVGLATRNFFLACTAISDSDLYGKQSQFDVEFDSLGMLEFSKIPEHIMRACWLIRIQKLSFLTLGLQEECGYGLTSVGSRGWGAHMSSTDWELVILSLVRKQKHGNSDGFRRFGDYM